jgi:hypothetical protein
MKLEKPQAAAEFFFALFSDAGIAGYFADPVKKTAAKYIHMRDEALVALCAEKHAELGHHHAANSLRKMLREGKLLP